MTTGRTTSWSYEALFALLEAASERLAPEEASRRFVKELGERLDLAGAAVWIRPDGEHRPPRQIASWPNHPAAMPTRDVARMTALPGPSQVWISSDGKEGLFALAAEGHLWLAGRTVGSVREIGEFQRLRLVFRRFAEGLQAAREHARSIRRLDDLAAAERRATEQAGRLAALVNSLEGAVLVETADRRIALANASFCRLFHVPAPPEALVGADCSHAAEGSKGLFLDPESFLAGVDRAISRRQPIASEVLEMADGKILERDFVPIHLANLPSGQAWHYREVTARVRAEREVARLKNFYEQILNSMPVQLAVFDRELRYLHVTPSAIADPETRQWVIGRTDLEYCARRGLAPEIAQARQNRVREALESSRSSTLEESFTDRSGALRHFVRFVHPVLDVAGQVVAVLGYGLDITERKQFEEQLTEANRAIAASAKARERFLANISHEIRTPLNAVIGMTYLLDDTALGPEQERYLAAIRYSADTLLSLINDVLDISKLEAGGVELEAIPFRVDSQLRELVAASRFDAERKGLHLGLLIGAGLDRTWLGDPARIRQVLGNLVSNAIKFTDSGTVEVVAEVAASAIGSTLVEISVSDSGIGIAPEKRAAIFEPFAQESPETARRFGGTGLGLAIVNEIVTRMNGTIAVRDREGGGTVFTVRLPLVPGPAEALADQTKDDAHSEQDLAGARVLVVEDNRLNQVVASRILRRFGATVTLAGGGLEALQHLGNSQFDLVLMDVQMPDLDGYATTQRVRQELALPADKLPILALTASVLPEERLRAAAAGMNDFIAKPFDPERIRQVIRTHLAASGWKSRARAALDARAASASTTKPPALEAEIDRNRLEMSAMGQPSLVVELLDLFVEDGPAGAGAVLASAARGDATGAAAAAHALKASAGAIGATQLEAVLAGLEKSAPTLAAPALVEEGRRIEALCRTAVDALRQLRPLYEKAAASDPSGEA